MSTGATSVDVSFGGWALHAANSSGFKTSSNPGFPKGGTSKAIGRLSNSLPSAVFKET
jgi:hypothetical protein